MWAGYYLGFKKPYDQSDAELKRSQNLLKSKKKNVRMFWASETDMQNAFASGDLWIAYAWPADWVAMKAKKLKVAYMYPKEGAISWIGMLMLGKNSLAASTRMTTPTRGAPPRRGRGSRTTTATATRTRARGPRRKT